MAVKFLSPEWVAAVRDGLAASPEFLDAIKGTRGRVQQVVHTDGEDILYWVEFTGTGFEMGEGPVERPTVTVTSDYATAGALASGQLSPMAAFMSGKVDVSNMMTAMGLQGALSKFGSVVKSIDTEF
jgi:putative sterol carrier protein